MDTDAIAFLLAGALHNLLIAGPAWPRPNQQELKRISPESPQPSPHIHLQCGQPRE